MNIIKNKATIPPFTLPALMVLRLTIHCTHSTPSPPHPSRTLPLDLRLCFTPPTQKVCALTLSIVLFMPKYRRCAIQSKTKTITIIKVISNLTHPERKALDALTKNFDLVIKSADKRRRHSHTKQS